MVRLVVCISVLPERFPNMLTVIDGFERQTVLPDHLVVSTPSNISLAPFLPSSGKLPVSYIGCRDRGPGSKLLCALPIVMRLFSDRRPLYLMLADDDMWYRPHACEIVFQHLLRHPHVATSFHTYTAPGDAFVIGQGADLFTMSASVLGGISDWADCLFQEDPRFFYHDDFWISAWLSTQNVIIQRVVSYPEKLVYMRIRHPGMWAGLEFRKGNLSRPRLNVELMRSYTLSHCTTHVPDDQTRNWTRP